MCRRVLWVAVLLTASFSFFGQSYLGVKADAGVSKMGNYPGVDASSITSYFQFSWRSGFTYSYRFKGISAIGVDLLYSNIAGREVISNPSGIPSSSLTSTQNLSYIAIPLYYTAHVKRFSVSAGGCLMFLVGGWTSGQIKQNYNGTNYESSQKNYKPNISTLDAGIIGSISYRVWKHLSVSLNGYYSLTPIFKGNQQFGANGGYGWSGRIIQFTGGLIYHVYESRGRAKTARPGNAILDMD